MCTENEKEHNGLVHRDFHDQVVSELKQKYVELQDAAQELFWSRADVLEELEKLKKTEIVMKEYEDHLERELEEVQDKLRPLKKDARIVAERYLAITEDVHNKDFCMCERCTMIHEIPEIAKRILEATKVQG